MSDKPETASALAGEIAEAVAEWMIKYPVTETMPQVIERILNANPLPRLAMSRDELEEVAWKIAWKMCGRGSSESEKRDTMKAVIVRDFLPLLSSEPPQPAKIVVNVGDRVRDCWQGKVFQIHSIEGEKYYTGPDKFGFLYLRDIAEVLPAEPEPAERNNGELCQCCGDRYETVYRVPNEVWKQIAPNPETIGDDPGHYGGLLCPDCADSRARESGAVLFWEAFEGDWHSCDEPELPAEPPKEEMPVCRVCSETMETVNLKCSWFNDGWLCVCPKHHVAYPGKTESLAIEAARNAGKGE